MKPNLKIGNTFKTDTGAWRVTDIGTRTIIAVRLDPGKDSSWYQGPPYAVAETVFDEDDLEAMEIDLFTPEMVEVDDNKTGIHWLEIAEAIQTWQKMQLRRASIADAALAFNTTPDVIRRAVSEAIHIFLSDKAGEDPAKQFIEHDGEA